MKKESKNYYKKIKTFCQEKGAGLFGVADISDIKDSFNLAEDEIGGMDKAVSVGFILSKKVLDGIKEHPAKLYYHHYRQVNSFLDQLALGIVNLLRQDGFNGLAIPASQIVDWEKQTAHLSHKRIAEFAGLGWIGRNNLLVNPKFGSQFRLVTVLTNAPILTFKARSSKAYLALACGDCRVCMTVCPAGAIKENPADFDHKACYEKLREFRKSGYVDQYICGLCVRVCPGSSTG